MVFIDSHAHIYSEEFSNDRSEMLNRLELAGISNILMPAIDSTTHEEMLKMEALNPQKYIPMMGLHPVSVGENVQIELQIIERYLNQRTFIAIGEIGLDFYWDVTYKNQQYEAFGQQLAWAIEYNLPIAIHSRNSMQECIELIKEFTPKGLRGVFHCFSGTLEDATRIIDEGFYLGIGGVLTFKNAGLDKIVKELPLDKLILETDSPYLSPVPYRGKRNEPAYLPLVAQRLADIKEMSIEAIASITTSNTKKLFRLPE